MLVNCAQDVKQTSRTRKPRLHPVRRLVLVFWLDIEGMCGSGWVFQVGLAFPTHRGAETNETIGLGRGLSW